MSDRIYAQSDKVIAFPISLDRTIVGYKDSNNSYSIEKKGDNYSSVTGYNGKIISEQNLTTLIRTLVDKDFVISSKSGDAGNIVEMSFLLNGYYFNVKESDAKDGDGDSYPSIFTTDKEDKSLYACLNYTKNTNDGYAYLTGDALSSTFNPIDYATLSIEFSTTNCGSLSLDKYPVPVTDNIKLAIKKDSSIILDTTNLNANTQISRGDTPLSFTNNKCSLTITEDVILTVSNQDGEQSMTPSSPSLVQYRGVYFTNSKPDLSIKYLQLLDETGNIPTDAEYKFTSKSIQNIDGGTI